MWTLFAAMVAFYAQLVSYTAIENGDKVLFDKVVTNYGNGWVNCFLHLNVEQWLHSSESQNIAERIKSGDPLKQYICQEFLFVKLGHLMLMNTCYPRPCLNPVEASVTTHNISCCIRFFYHNGSKGEYFPLCCSSSLQNRQLLFWNCTHNQTNKWNANCLGVKWTHYSSEVYVLSGQTFLIPLCPFTTMFLSGYWLRILASFFSSREDYSVLGFFHHRQGLKNSTWNESPLTLLKLLKKCADTGAMFRSSFRGVGLNTWWMIQKQSGQNALSQTMSQS